MAATGQVWGTDADGGFMYSDQLSYELRMAVQPILRFRQFADVKDATHQGLHKGDTFAWNVYQDVAAQGGALDEDDNDGASLMPATKFTITQATMTITEYGNSVPYTGKLDSLSLHPVREVIRKVLKNDCKKALDIAAAIQFDSTLLKLSTTDGAAIVLDVDGVASAINAAGGSLGKDQIKMIVDIMKERSIPAFMSDDYYCMAWPTTFRPLKDDLEAIKMYTDTGYGFIMNGEIGRYEGMRFVEQTNIPKGGANDLKDGSGMGFPDGAWVSGNDWAVFMGEDTVAEAVAIPEEIRGKIPTNYGLSRGVAWYYLGGFGIVHNATGADQNRILLWDTAVV